MVLFARFDVGGSAGKVTMQHRASFSEECSSHGELLLHPPQGLRALHQLLLLLGLQRHVDHICEAAVAQHARDAQEDLILDSMHPL